MDGANRWIAPVLGLPELPFVDFGDDLLQDRPDGVHWKTGPLVDHANGRPFAWVDDEQSDPDDAYVSARHHAGRLRTMSTRGSVCARTTSGPSATSPGPWTRHKPSAEPASRPSDRSVPVPLA
ncbi:secreted protein [Streptomyces pristinaespiralis ATCC 25486]|uniref:Secreted protein n=1 Tax=Streptomyces pristinaespiralis (strain ATCC 25486 / DSM 40338 / CBS 914.69 / JCM 4507 / KCC S-0507 / NBRC 13074 / NRRL 2958 / 5647) TaxID=457429 RepID=B5HC66_STRE2|nr:secreted protein [Streptomyces pristinaespiralis ATCC 25486]